jgi:hypothetical protein
MKHTKTTVIKEYCLYIKSILPSFNYRIVKPLILNQLIIDGGRLIIYSIDNLTVIDCINYINKYISENYNIPIHYTII